jgi:hypothetical protein
MTAKELICELQKILKAQKGCDYPVLVHDTGLGYDLQPIASISTVPELEDSEENVVILMTEWACKTIADLKVFRKVHGYNATEEELERWVNSPAGKAALAEHHDSEGKIQIEKR